MEEKERDAFDDMFRLKLHDFEADPLPGDWEAIADRLEVKKSVPFRRTLRYWAAAAVVSLLVMTGGFRFFNRDGQSQPVAAIVQEATDEFGIASSGQPEPTAPAVVTSALVSRRAKRTVAQVATAVAPRPNAVADEEVALLSKADNDVPIAVVSSDTVAATEEERREADEAVTPVETQAWLAEAAPMEKEEKKAPMKRWSFGMGGGSVSAGTSNSLNAYPLKSGMMMDQVLGQLNSPYFNSQSLKTNIHHKTPVSVGLGVSYALNNRFSLQSGLNYTLLSSDWETGAVYRGVTKQKLHFLGLPLSLSYQIAEWKRIRFYAAAGGMTEVNVAGKQSSKIWVENDEIRHAKKHIRMKEWMWSVNARVGASYPLLRFLSVYAEVGTDYYFDNGSDIETIRSEKPFNVNLQAGFRFGF